MISHRGISLSMYLVGDRDDSFLLAVFEGVSHPIMRIHDLSAAALDALHEDSGDLTISLFRRVDERLQLADVQIAQLVF